MKKNASGIIPGFSPNRGPIKIYNCPPKTHYCYIAKKRTFFLTGKIFSLHLIFFISTLRIELHSLCLFKKVCIHVGRSGGVRSTIEEQLIAILSAGKYSSDFNAKKIVSVARSVPEISSVEWGKVGPFFTQIISWKAFIETSNNGKSKAHNWQISTKKCNLINWNAYLSHESIYFLEGKLLELKNIYSASLILPVEIQDGRLRRRQFSIWHFWHINSLWNTIYCYREVIIMAWYEHLFNA